MRTAPAVTLMAVVVLAGCDGASEKSSQPSPTTSDVFRSRGKSTTAPKQSPSSTAPKRSTAPSQPDPPAPSQPGDPADVSIGGIDFVAIPEGYFVMGSPTDEFGHREDEEQRFVSVFAPFYLSRTEITQGQFEDVCGHNPSGFQGPGLPVTRVTFDDATIFCELLSEEHPEWKFFLPTEEQWEYACRSGSKLPYSPPLGHDEDLRISLDKYEQGDEDYLVRFVRRFACFHDQQPLPVASLLPNEWSLHDMHGNVWEWCRPADGFDPGYGHAPIRGGAWSSPDIRGVRSAIRSTAPVDEQKDSIGFRVAAERN